MACRFVPRRVSLPVSCLKIGQRSDKPWPGCPGDIQVPLVWLGSHKFSYSAAEGRAAMRSFLRVGWGTCKLGGGQLKAETMLKGGSTAPPHMPKAEVPSRFPQRCL
jgi:hypothetical protein